MSPSRTFLLAGLAVAAVELLLALALRGTILAWYFVACAALTALIALCARHLLTPRDDEDGGGGRGPGPPPDDEPPWWPEFEARLRAYERGRGRAPV